MTKIKFATYTRGFGDAAGFHGDNRYYSNAYGRSITPDPYQASGGPGDPQSWNRYSYTRGDPTNRNDTAGLCDSDDPSCVSHVTLRTRSALLPMNAIRLMPVAAWGA